MDRPLQLGVTVTQVSERPSIWQAKTRVRYAGVDVRLVAEDITPIEAAALLNKKVEEECEKRGWPKVW